METLRYDYRPKTWIMALCSLLFAGFAVVLFQEARSNDRGMIINGLIELDTGQSTVFLWALTGMSVLFVAVGIYGLVRSFGAPREIVVDASSITAPKSGLGGKIVVVRFADVSDLEMQQVQSQHFLMIHHRDGKLNINRSMMPNKADFEALVAAITDRCRIVGQRSR